MKAPSPQGMSLRAPSLPSSVADDPFVAFDTASDSSPPSCDVSAVARDTAQDCPLGEQDSHKIIGEEFISLDVSYTVAQNQRVIWVTGGICSKAAQVAVLYTPYLPEPAATTFRANEALEMPLRTARNLCPTSRPSFICDTRRKACFFRGKSDVCLLRTCLETSAKMRNTNGLRISVINICAKLRGVVLLHCSLGDGDP